LQNIRKYIIGFGICLLLAGCGAASIQELRSAPSGTLAFTTDMSYESAYQIIVNRARDCFVHNFIDGRLLVNGQIDSEKKAATIHVNNATGINMGVHLLIEITALNNRQTKIVNYYDSQRWEERAKIIEFWVRTKSTDCQPQ